MASPEDGAIASSHEFNSQKGRNVHTTSPIQLIKNLQPVYSELEKSGTLVTVDMCSVTD